MKFLKTWMYSFWIKLKINDSILQWNMMTVCQRLFPYPVSISPSLEFLAEKLSQSLLQVNKIKVVFVCTYRTFKNTFFLSAFLFSCLWCGHLIYISDDFGGNLRMLSKDNWAEIQNESTPILILWNSCTNSGLPASCISLYKIKINLFVHAVVILLLALKCIKGIKFFYLAVESYG